MCETDLASLGPLLVDAKPAEKMSLSICQVFVAWQMFYFDTLLLLSKEG